jgi:precorrin-2 dehydrogenase/sirohydrochlorin ferrochelatase
MQSNGDKYLMSYYPILVELENQKVLVVGGGKVAQRKIETLLQYGAEILIVSRELTGPLEKYVADGRISHVGTEFDEELPGGLFMVIAATDDAQLNERISVEAKRKGILINAVDQPSDCTFIVPSIIKRGDLLIAISTSGKSPALAKKIRKELETKFGKRYEDLLALMGVLRKMVLDMGLPQKENSRIFHELVDSPILDAIEEQDIDRVTSTINRILNRSLVSSEVKKFLKAR